MKWNTSAPAATLLQGQVTILRRPTDKDEPVADFIRELEGDITALLEARAKSPLKLVASEITTQSKVVFPQDWPLFYKVST
jgi:hypothetical protein